MADFSLISDHPDNKEILSKLLGGTTPKEVNQWLKIKYPEKSQSHLRLSTKLLKEFVDSQYTSLYEQFQTDLDTISSAKDTSDLPLSLQNNKTYREALQEIADKELNSVNLLQGNIGLLLNRLEQIYDLIQADPGNVQHDYKLTALFKTIKEGIDTLEKIKQNSVDSLSEHNLTMQSVQDNMAIMQDAVRETLLEMDPELASRFMEKLVDKLNRIDNPILSPTQKDNEIQAFSFQAIQTLED